jgi:hypothetical protein
MATRARQYGLAFRRDAFAADGGWGVPESGLPAVRPDPLGPMHESWKWFYRLWPPARRRIGTVDPAHEYVASSAVARAKADDEYHPARLETYLADPSHQELDTP